MRKKNLTERESSEILRLHRITLGLVGELALSELFPESLGRSFRTLRRQVLTTDAKEVLGVLGLSPLSKITRWN